VRRGVKDTDVLRLPGGQTALLSTFAWLVFGASLIFSGWRMLCRTNNEATDYRNNRALRLMRRVVPFTEEYHGDNFFVKRDELAFSCWMLKDRRAASSAGVGERVGTISTAGMTPIQALRYGMKAVTETKAPSTRT
jgi:hypothetical protein